MAHRLANTHEAEGKLEFGFHGTIGSLLFQGKESATARKKGVHINIGYNPASSFAIMRDYRMFDPFVQSSQHCACHHYYVSCIQSQNAVCHSFIFRSLVIKFEFLSQY